jgi:hypothetical protein
MTPWEREQKRRKWVTALSVLLLIAAALALSAITAFSFGSSWEDGR